MEQMGNFTTQLYKQQYETQGLPQVSKRYRFIRQRPIRIE